MKQMPLNLRKKFMPKNIHNDEHAELLFLMPSRILDKRLKYQTAPTKLLLDLADKHDYTFAYGYRIWRYKGKNWRFDLDTFLVSKKGIVDPSNRPWEDNVELHYCAVDISRETLIDQTFLKANTLKFVKERSPFRLFERDYNEDTSKS